MLLEIEHALRFAYDDYVSESHMELRMQPRATAQQVVRAFSLAVGPQTRVSRYLDWNENVVHHFSIAAYHDVIEIVARSVVESAASHPPLAAVTAARAPEGPRGRLRDFTTFGGPVRPSAALTDLARGVVVPEGAGLGAELEAVGHHVADHLRYAGVTDYRSTTDDVLAAGAGVCQDFAHVMLGLLRHRGVPCRYVSGYLHDERSDGQPAQSHAWVEAHAPADGWVAFDPTHRRMPDERYVVVAYGRHYDDVPPNRGIFRGNTAERLSAEVRTREVTGIGPGAAREEIGRIDLPAYAEPPSPPAPARRPPDQDVDPQQQQ